MSDLLSYNALQPHFAPEHCPHHEMLSVMDLHTILQGGEARCPSCGILISLERIQAASRWRPQCIGCGKFLKRDAKWNQCADCDTRDYDY